MIFIVRTFPASKERGMRLFAFSVNTALEFQDQYQQWVAHKKITFAIALLLPCIISL